MSCLFANLSRQILTMDGSRGQVAECELRDPQKHQSPDRATATKVPDAVSAVPYPLLWAD